METMEIRRQNASAERIAAGSEEHRRMHEAAERARRITAQMNNGYRTQEELQTLFAELTGQQKDESLCIFPPFYTDCGQHLRVGRHVFFNEGCCLQDQGGIEIGDHCLIGQQVVFATLNHDLSAERRADMIPAPIRVGKHVWIGAHATILPGVTVGDHAVIAAGAVVAKDVPADTVVAGVPAKIIRRIAPKE